MKALYPSKFSKLEKKGRYKSSNYVLQQQYGFEELIDQTASRAISGSHTPLVRSAQSTIRPQKA